MIIRKKYTVEIAHVLKNSYTERCQSLHGHRGIIEVFLERKGNLDKNGMVIDFSMLKKGTPIGDFIDSFDHSFVMEKDSEHKMYIKSKFDRWIEMFDVPAAENLSLIIHYYIDKLIKNHPFYEEYKNFVKCNSVIYHETDTGYAQTQIEDLLQNLERKIQFSESIMRDWAYPVKDYTWDLYTYLE